MSRGAKILVTGGAGFIGSALVRRLHAGGARVVALDNLTVGRWEHLAGLDSVEHVVGDVRDPAAMANALRGVTIVYHLACVNQRHSIGAPMDAHDVNATGTLVALEASRKVGIQRFVHVSSSEVYGSALTVPMSEGHPVAPTTPYGASKLAGEAYARAWYFTYGLPVVVVRPFNAYGPRSHTEGSSGEVIPRFVRCALAGEPMTIFGDGEQTRDFTHVDDTARGIAAAGTTVAVVGRTFNLGSGAQVSVNALADLVCEAVGCAVARMYLPARPGDVRRLVADTTQARGALAYSPRVVFEVGLRELVNEMRDREARSDAGLTNLRVEPAINWGA